MEKAMTLREFIDGEVKYCWENHKFALANKNIESATYWIGRIDAFWKILDQLDDLNNETP